MIQLDLSMVWSGDILDGLVLYIVATIMLAMIFKKIIATLK